MAFDPLEGIQHLEAHLARMKASATALGFRFDRHDARNELQAATFRLRDVRRIRLLLARSGALVVEVGPAPARFDGVMPVRIVPLPVSPLDLRLRHKTSARGFYDAARAAAGTGEVVFETPDGLLTEGSYTSLFVPRGDVLVTPPLAQGLLPGILRGHLIETGRAIEGTLTRADLQDGFLLGNALRGLFRAQMVAD
jgi:para-aminobenzoate synthetase/4-amino-4-deoxychorismate lyase